MKKTIFALFLSWKMLTLFFACIATLFIPMLSVRIDGWLGIKEAPDSFYYLWIWANFDGVHYLHIAKEGYSYPLYAYFPLVSLLIFLVNKIFFLSPLLSGLLITNIALLLSLFMLVAITTIDYGKKIALASVMLLLAFPFSFFYQAVYTDALYLCLSLISFYCARRRQWLAAGIFGAFATNARLVGIMLPLALVVEWYIQQEKPHSYLTLIRHFFTQKAYFIFLCPLGLIAYATYLYINFGDFLLFQKAMDNWDQADIVFPPQVVFRYLKIFYFSPFGDPLFWQQLDRGNFSVLPSVSRIEWVALVEFTATFFYFFLAFYTLIKIRVSYGVFMITSLLLSTFTGTFASMPRYILHVFPAFIALALLTEKSKTLFYTTLVLFLILQFVFLCFFTRGYFIA